ncbi:MAG: GGDEF domain-containing protein [Desulfovibrionaceae bacterium]|nr:GGDEF domain-containing protein [Desulfovibrionaceae bacterium]
MQQVSFRLKNLEDIDVCLQELQGQHLDPYISVLVSIFSGWSGEHLVRPIVEKIQQMYPEAIIVGSSSEGEIWQGQVSLETTVLHFLFFQATRLQARIINFVKSSVGKATRSIMELSQDGEGCAGIKLLLAKNDARAHSLLAKVKDLPASLPIFGGVARTTLNIDPYVFLGQEFVYHGIVAIFFRGSNLHVQVKAIQGWHPLGPYFRITKMKAGNIITELDNLPPYKVYEKYLDISRQELQQDNMFFLLFLERNQHSLLRLPVAVTSEGALKMSADCRLGERVRLAYGDPAKILDASRSVHDLVATFKPEAILLFNCVTRRLFLGEAANQDLKPFQDIAPSVGFYTGGEIARMRDGDTSLLNMSMVAVGLGEGTPIPMEDEEIPPTISKKSLPGPLKLLYHLTHFIAVTSNELVEANLQLAELASTDKLTGLYNRRAIENILKKKLLDQSKEPTINSAIMLDLDDFKQVNDIFGHDVGDQVLKWLGKVLKENIRRTDAAGRWGGEEFLIFLPGSDLKAAKQVAERIRHEFSAGFKLPNGQEVTCSLGVADYAETSTYMDFYRLLDAALYRAKQTGKNRVCSPEDFLTG